MDRWGWALLWAALVLGAVAVLALTARTTWRKAKVVRDELSAARDVLTGVGSVFEATPVSPGHRQREESNVP